MLGKHRLTVVDFVGSTSEIHIGPTHIFLWNQRGTKMLVPS